jgi:two-component system OmpR family response regulator
MKILLIEDDPETIAYIARGLREHGHLVELAADGRNGLFMGTDGGPTC